MRNMTNQNRLKALVRHEFSFYANDNALNNIFEKIAADGVAIIAFTITNRMNVNFVRMIAGPLNSNSSFANKVVRNALRSERIQYDETEVIQIIFSPSPGVGLGIFQALRNMRVFAAYSAANGIIINGSDTQTVLNLLKQAHVIR